MINLDRVYLFKYERFENKHSMEMQIIILVIREIKTNRTL